MQPQNDDLTTIGADRFALYRRCRVEDIEIPTVRGDISDVPLQEVCISYSRVLIA